MIWERRALAGRRSNRREIRARRPGIPGPERWPGLHLLLGHPVLRL